MKKKKIAELGAKIVLHEPLYKKLSDCWKMERKPLTFYYVFEAMPDDGSCGESMFLLSESSGEVPILLETGYVCKRIIGVAHTQKNGFVAPFKQVGNIIPIKRSE